MNSKSNWNYFAAAGAEEKTLVVEIAVAVEVEWPCLAEGGEKKGVDQTAQGA